MSDDLLETPGVADLAPARSDEKVSTNLETKEINTSTELEEIGVFKFKDKVNRNGVMLLVENFPRPVSELKAIYVLKVPRESNRMKIVFEWIKKSVKTDQKPSETEQKVTENSKKG